MSINSALEKRYATKGFDSSFKINNSDKDALLQSICLTATSFGLQPFKLLYIEDQATKEALFTHSFNQAQVSQCSALLVFAIETKVDEGFIDKYIQNIAQTRGIETQALEGYKNMQKNFLIDAFDQNKRNIWATNQAYIALGTALAQASVLGLDACPMEGFDRAGYDKTLGLQNKHLSSVVVLAVGKRSEEDQTQHYKKVRRPIDQMVIYG